MKPIYAAGLIVLTLNLVLALIGMVLAGNKALRVRHAAMFCRISTLLVLMGAYFLLQSDWPGVHLRTLDLWSILVILAILAYALVWAAVAYQLNKSSHEEFGNSFMLSMLYRDSELPHPPPPADAKSARPKVG